MRFRKAWRRVWLGCVAAGLVGGGCIFGGGSKPVDEEEDAGNDVAISDMELDRGTPPEDAGQDTSAMTDTTTASDVPVVPDMPGPDVGYGESCDDEPPAPRCLLDPSETVWGPASVVEAITVVGSEGCCYDFDGEAGFENHLGDMLFAFSQMDSQDAIDGQLGSGNFVLVFEYPKLDDKLNDDSMNLYVYRGDGPVSIDPPMTRVDVLRDDLVQGSFARNRFDSVQLLEGTIEARQGTVWLPLPLPGFGDLQVRVVDARMDLTLDAAGTQLPEPGVKATGTIGGAVLIDELFRALNEAAAECPCLELSDTDPYIDIGTQTCNADLQANAGDCGARCLDLATACEEYTGFTNDLDVAVNGQQNDALSIGYRLEVAAAVINGAAP